MVSRYVKKTFISALILCVFSVNAVFAQSGLPGGVQKVTSIEGVTEYRLANGLQVLLFPDPTKQNTTVNIIYHVGSRHENYGETGMAHLLEHLLFKGTPKHANIPAELTSHVHRRTARPGMTAQITLRRLRRRTKTLIGLWIWNPTEWLIHISPKKTWIPSFQS